jgi:hypothetical protein
MQLNSAAIHRNGWYHEGRAQYITTFYNLATRPRTRHGTDNRNKRSNEVLSQLLEWNISGRSIGSHVVRKLQVGSTGSGCHRSKFLRSFAHTQNMQPMHGIANLLWNVHHMISSDKARLIHTPCIVSPSHLLRLQGLRVITKRIIP